jgi:anti-sigma B factor antagonist
VDIRRESAPDAVVYRISGKLDSLTGPQLGSAFAPDEEGARVILDMREVTFISSAGLRGIMQAARRIQAAKGGIAIFGLQSLVKEVFDASGFGNFIPIGADEIEARAKLGE